MNESKPEQVLELGAGCGTLGLTLARNLPHAAEVCLTEQAFGGALQHLRRNVAANSHLPHMASVTCCACDWTHFMQPGAIQAAAEAAEAAAAAAAAAADSGTPAAAADSGTPAAAAACAVGVKAAGPGGQTQQHMGGVSDHHHHQQQQQQQQQGGLPSGPAVAAGGGEGGGGGSAGSSSGGDGVSVGELLDLNKLLTTPWDVIVGTR